MQQETPQFTERHIVIVGVGLIGGSIAAAIHSRFPGCRVTGIGRNVQRLARAAEAGLLTDWSDRITSDLISRKSFGVVCLPAEHIADAAQELLSAGCELVTDAGSVKSQICRAMSQSRRFVGAHPIAGSELSGFEHADPDLFCGRVCVVTPTESAPADTTRVEDFWRALGMIVHRMTPDEHDRVLALTSHLPHILASVAAGCVPLEFLSFTGTGYRDTTRIAASSAGLWTSILMANATHCIDSIQTAETLLKEFRTALETRDRNTLAALWKDSATRRRSLESETSPGAVP